MKIKIQEDQLEKYFVDQEDKSVCIIEVNENLRRVRIGQELTRPLKILNKNCDFRKKYDKAFNIWEADKIKKEKSDKSKEYYKNNKKRILSYQFYYKNRKKNENKFNIIARR